MDRKDDARQEAQKVLDLPVQPDWAPEDREFKQKAKPSSNACEVGGIVAPFAHEVTT